VGQKKENLDVNMCVKHNGLLTTPSSKTMNGVMDFNNSNYAYQDLITLPPKGYRNKGLLTSQRILEYAQIRTQLLTF
jgi:hypothetical protein